MSNLPGAIGGAGGVSLAVAPLPQVTAFPAVNTINLGGNTMPGKWTLHRATKIFGWQQQMGYGLSGAYLLPKGDPLVLAEFRVDFWAHADYLIFRQLKKILLAKAALALPGGIATCALGINHPELNEMGVSSVVVSELGAAIQQDGGLWEVRISFLQYRPFSPALAPPRQAIPAATVAPPIAANATQAENIGLAAGINARLHP